jgi:hypothetical protein
MNFIDGLGRFPAGPYDFIEEHTLHLPKVKLILGIADMKACWPRDLASQGFFSNDVIRWFG